MAPHPSFRPFHLPGSSPLRPPWAARARVAASLSLLLSGCGGGGGSGSAASTSSAPAAAAATQAADDGVSRRIAMAEKVYVGVPRVPAGFALDAAPAGATGPVATAAPQEHRSRGQCAEPAARGLHRRRRRGAVLVRAACHAGRARMPTSSRPTVRDACSSSSAYRVPTRRRGCDIASSSVRTWIAAAPTSTRSPAQRACCDPCRSTSRHCRPRLSTCGSSRGYNNADHVVLASGAASAAVGQLAWRLEMVRLTRDASAADCDRIDRLAWVHVAEIASGALTRRLETLETFRARRENGVVQLCAG